MNRVLNILIIILTIGILFVGGIIAYRIISFQKHTISFKLNGATSITSDRITCKLSLQGCIIELPDVTRTDGNIIGYSFNKDDHTAKYHPGDKLLIKNDYDLFSISYKEIVVSIDKNGTDYLEKDSLKCTLFNEDKSCKLKLPFFNKKGYQTLGYSTSKTPTSTYNSYFQNEEYEFKENIKLYPNYTSTRGKKENRVYQVQDAYILDNKLAMEFDKSVSQTTINDYKKIINDLNKHMPYYLTGTKITIFNEAEFVSRWGGNGSVLGINYSVNASKDDYPLSRSLDILAASRIDYMKKYYILVHELGHSFDFYYGYGVNKPIEITTDYASDSGKQSIASQSDIKVLYNKYKKMGDSAPLRDYAYTNIHEFVAEALAYYYMTFTVPTAGYKQDKYPTELKQVIEKYLCIDKNNYNEKVCS